MKLNLLTLMLGVTLAFVLIPPFGIIGVIFAPVIAGKPSLIWMIYWIRKHNNIRIDLRSPLKILVASAISAAVTYLSLSLLPAIEWIRLSVGALIFLGTCLLIIPMIGAITKDEIHNLRGMFSGLGIISKIIRIPLSLLERILDARSNSNKTSETQ